MASSGPAFANSALTSATEYLTEACADGRERFIIQVENEVNEVVIHDLSLNPTSETAEWDLKKFRSLCETHKRLITYHCHPDPSHPLRFFPSSVVDGSASVNEPSDLSTVVTQLFECASEAARAGRRAPDISNFVVVTGESSDNGGLVGYGLEDSLYEEVKRLGTDHGRRPLNAARELFSGNPSARSLIDYEKGNRELLDKLDTIRVGVNRAYWDDLEAYILEHCHGDALQFLGTCAALTVEGFVDWLPGNETYFVRPYDENYTPHLRSTRTVESPTEAEYVSSVSEAEKVPVVDEYTFGSFVNTKSAILITCGIAPFDDQHSCTKGVRFAKEIEKSCRTAPHIGIVDGLRDAELVESQRAAGELRAPAVLLYQDGRMLRTKNHSDTKASFYALVLCGMDNMFGHLRLP